MPSDVLGIFEVVFLQPRVMFVISVRAVNAVSVGNFFAEKERSILCYKLQSVSPLEY